MTSAASLPLSRFKELSASEALRHNDYQPKQMHVWTKDCREERWTPDGDVGVELKDKDRLEMDVTDK